MPDPSVDKIAEINERVSMGILLREDSIYLLDKLAEVEVELRTLQEQSGITPTVGG
jgi:uncharacterized protein YaeQ